MTNKHKFIWISGIRYVILNNDLIRVFIKISKLSGQRKLAIKRHCEFCGKEFLTLLHNPTECCSIKCGSNLKIQIYIPGQENQRFKDISYRCVNEAVKKQKLFRPKDCPYCGKKTKIEGHHPDYNKPNEIMWLCKSCHIKLHAKHYIQSDLVVF